MKFLLLILLAGLGLATASSLLPHSLNSEVQFYNDVNEEHFYEEVSSDDDDIKTELGKKLREHLDEILAKVKDALDNGKVVKEDLLQKMKEIREKLKELKLDLGDKAKKLLEELKEKAKDYWRKILDRLKLKDSPSLADDDEVDSLRKRLEELMEEVTNYRNNDQQIPRDILLELKKTFEIMEQKNIQLTTVELLVKWAVDYYLKNLNTTLLHALSADEGEDLARNLRERFEEILEKIKDAIENRKLPGGNVVAKLREIYKQMKEKSIPFGDKAKELLERLKEKATGLLKRILDKMNPSEAIPASGTGAENLRERLQELLEKLKESFRDRKLPGKGFISKLRQIREEMRQKNVPLGGKLKEMIEKMKESTTGVWRRVLERLGRRGPETSNDLEVLYGTGAENLKERLQELLEKLKESFRDRKLPGKGFLSKLRQIREEMRQKNVPLGGKLKEMIEKMKESTTGVWRRILDRLGRRGGGTTNELEVFYEDPKTELGKALKKHLEDILDKLKDIIDNGKTYKDDLVEKAKDIVQKLKDMKVDIGDHAKQVLKDLKEKAKDYWKKILDKLSFDSETNGVQVYMDDPKTELGKALKKHLEDILDKLKDIIENGKTYKEDLVEKAKDIAQKLKDMHVDIGDYARKTLNNLKEKAKDYWNKILNKLRLD